MGSAVFAPDGVTCDTSNGYTGTVSYTQCTTAGNSYSVSGCLATCLTPSDLPGYDFTAAGGNLQESAYRNQFA